jgi:polyhydroxyalkanoate synthase
MMALHTQDPETVMLSLLGIGQSPKRLIWTKNKARLYRYEHTIDNPIVYQTPLLIVYALINKPYILDLLPERSFIAYLVKHGVDVYLLDWGTPGPEDQELCFDDLVMKYLPRAIRQVLKTSGQSRVNLFGYYIGGVLNMLYAAMYPNAPLCSIILLATPVDFSDAGLLGSWLNARFFDADRLVGAMGNVHPAFITGGAMLVNAVGNPSLLPVKDKDERFLEVWIALWFWGIDGIPFPGEAFRQWIRDFYQGNKLINNHLLLAGRCVLLSQITAPLMTIAAEEDILVPLQQVKSALQAVSSAERELVTLPGSHFALMAGSRAANDLWPRVVDWIAQH